LCLHKLQIIEKRISKVPVALSLDYIVDHGVLRNEPFHFLSGPELGINNEVEEVVLFIVLFEIGDDEKSGPLKNIYQAPCCLLFVYKNIRYKIQQNYIDFLYFTFSQRQAYLIIQINLKNTTIFLPNCL